MNQNEQSSKKKYHLFCGDKILEGYVNVDLYNPMAQVKANSLLVLDSEVDEIYMHHGIEHLTFREAEEALKNWHSMLKDGGLLHMVHPDMTGAAKILLEGNKPDWVWEVLFWGYQTNDGQFHKSGWTEKTMRRRLEKAGFKGIEITHRRPYEMTVRATK